MKKVDYLSFYFLISNYLNKPNMVVKYWGMHLLDPLCSLQAGIFPPKFIFLEMLHGSEDERNANQFISIETNAKDHQISTSD